MKTKPKRQHRWPADPLSASRLLCQLEPFTETELVSLLLPIRSSFDSLSNGTGGLQDYCDVVAAINSASMRGSEVGKECTDITATALHTLKRMWFRSETSGVWAFENGECADVEIAIDLHEQLVRLSTPLQMTRAIKRVMSEMNVVRI